MTHTISRESAFCFANLFFLTFPLRVSNDLRRRVECFPCILDHQHYPDVHNTVFVKTDDQEDNVFII